MIRDILWNSISLFDIAAIVAHEYLITRLSRTRCVQSCCATVKEEELFVISSFPDVLEFPLDASMEWMEISYLTKSIISEQIVKGQT